MPANGTFEHKANGSAPAAPPSTSSSNSYRPRVPAVTIVDATKTKPVKRTPKP